MTNEKRQTKLKELRTLEAQIKKIMKELGLIPMSEAAQLRNSTRQALIQLADAERVDKVKILEDVMGEKAHTFFFRDQITKFKPLRS